MNYAQYDWDLGQSYAYDAAIENLTKLYKPDYEEIAEYIDLALLIKLIAEEKYGRAYELVGSVAEARARSWAESTIINGMD